MESRLIAALAVLDQRVAARWIHEHDKAAMAAYLELTYLETKAALEGASLQLGTRAA